VYPKAIAKEVEVYLPYLGAYRKTISHSEFSPGQN
jgi:hypothetical protein